MSGPRPLRGEKVYIMNRTSNLDKIRDIKPIEEKVELFPLKPDNKISSGKGLEELNLVIIIPKSNKRARGEDISVDMLLKNRTKDPANLEMLTLKYTGRNSSNIRKVQLKLEIASLMTGKVLGQRISKTIGDSNSSVFGALDIFDVAPLSSCEMGGQKVIIAAEFRISHDVFPVFQLFNVEGKRIIEVENMDIQQP